MLVEEEHMPKTWRELTNRLSGIADRECHKRGFAIMSVDILVHPNGQPVMFTEPRVRKLETRHGAYEFLTKIIELLADNEIRDEHIDKSKV